MAEPCHRGGCVDVLSLMHLPEFTPVAVTEGSGGVLTAAPLSVAPANDGEAVLLSFCLLSLRLASAPSYRMDVKDSQSCRWIRRKPELQRDQTEARAGPFTLTAKPGYLGTQLCTGVCWSLFRSPEFILGQCWSSDSWKLCYYSSHTGL